MAVALLALAGCDRFGFFPGGATGNDSKSAAADNAATASARPKANGPSDAGVTTSRSLAGLSGGQQGLGDKEAGAIQAGAQSFPAEMLLGSWSDDGNCKLGIEFRPDGTFQNANGEGGNWSLEGDVLTVSGGGGRMQLRIQSIDAGRVVTINPDGTTGQSTRC
ncbi:MAG: hypothetical protein ACXWUP_04965 [Allosphingosinicella sp.]